VERLREELQIAQGLAQTDPLTALLNRRGLDQRISQLPETEMEKTAALFIDIDHFKTVNDTHGHLLGDRVIAVVATIIKTCVGERGFCARMGGEEFAVIMTGINPASAAEMSERIRATVEKGRIRRQDSEEVIGSITVSVGAATPIANEKIADMMRRADRALYKSKQDGRNRITISTRSDN
jgi:diguanylate cyclase